MEACQGPVAHGLAEARRRLKQGLHPHPSKKRMTLGPARGLSLAARAAWRAVLDPAQTGEESAKYGLEWQPLPVETVAGLHGFHSAQAAVVWERKRDLSTASTDRILLRPTRNVSENSRT